MKKVALYLVLSLSLVSGSSLFTSCSHRSSNAKKVDLQSKEYASAYICPMHCEGSGADRMGTCPVCKMDYVKNENK